MLPILYKKTSTGAIQYWKVSVQEVDNCGVIDTEYGQVGTDSPQFSSDTVTKGKNVGKKNATTALQQAEAEAKALWTGKKKKGYVETSDSAEADERDEVITGGVDPMLAHHYMDVIYDLRPDGTVTYEKSDESKKIAFPCYGQPKLNGIRCLAVFKDGKATLWTRTRKPILSCPHVITEIERLIAGRTGVITLDGELYNHELKDDFEKIVSAVRKDEPTKESLNLVQYHIYDIANLNIGFGNRIKMISKLFENFESSVLKEVQTISLNEDEVIPVFEAYCIVVGYEGLMLRNADSKYVGKRSYDLQKAKPFQDDEFEIVGFTEGRGKLAGKLGTFICKTKAGNEFETPMNGTQELLERLFKEGNSNKGKKLTIRYQGYTGKNKVPRCPKGHSIRDYE